MSCLSTWCGLLFPWRKGHSCCLDPTLLSGNVLGPLPSPPAPHQQTLHTPETSLTLLCHTQLSLLCFSVLFLISICGFSVICPCKCCKKPTGFSWGFPCCLLMLFDLKSGLFFNSCAGGAVGWWMEMLLDRFPLPLVGLGARISPWCLRIAP